jgi:diacylglycerol kinase (ATP)
MKAVIIANPVAGKGRHYQRLQKHLHSGEFPGWKIEFLSTRGPGDAGRMASGLTADPPDLLAVCGGDGTMKEVVTLLPDPPFPVALLPAGTANVLAREIGLPLDPVRALNIALQRRVMKVDLPRLQGTGAHRFLLMAGIGFDAYIAARVRPGVKKKIGILAYYLAVLQGLLNYRFTGFRVSVGKSEYSAVTCVVANARSYGGGLVLTPAANMTDGKLDLFIMKPASRPAYAALALSAKFGGTAARFSFVERLQTEFVSIDGPPGIRVQVDGETVENLPVEISLSGDKFPLVVI